MPEPISRLIRELSRGTKICQRTDLKSKDLEANGAFRSDGESYDKLQGRSLSLLLSAVAENRICDLQRSYRMHHDAASNLPGIVEKVIKPIIQGEAEKVQIAFQVETIRIRKFI